MGCCNMPEAQEEVYIQPQFQNSVENETDEATPEPIFATMTDDILNKTIKWVVFGFLRRVGYKTAYIAMDVQILCCKYVGDATSIDIHDSDILVNETSRKLLLSLLCMKWKSRFITFELLWKTNHYMANRWNWSEHCMNHKNIFVILQSKDEKKFAAFSSITWAEYNFGKRFYDKNAFLVQFDPFNSDTPYLCPIDERLSNTDNFGIESWSVGPVIGSGHDFTFLGCKNAFIVNNRKSFTEANSFKFKDPSWVRSWYTQDVEIYRVHGV